jgi:hypothetical protein
VADKETLDCTWEHTFAKAILTSGTGDTATNVLTDDTKSWTPDDYIGYRLLVDSSYYTIVDNDATTITVSTTIGTNEDIAYSVIDDINDNLLTYMGSCFSSSIVTSPVKTVKVTRSEILTSGTGDTATEILTDDTQAWTPDDFIGKTLQIGGVFYTITDNDETTITVSTTIGTNEGIAYVVIDTGVDVLLKPTSSTTDTATTWTVNATNSSGDNCVITACGIGTLGYTTSYYADMPISIKTWNNGTTYTITIVLEWEETA